MWRPLEIDTLNWVTAIFMLLFAILVFSYKNYPNQSRLFFKIFDFDTYLKVNRKNIALQQVQNFHNKLNLFSIVVITLLIAQILDYYYVLLLGFYNYLRLFAVIGSIVLLRHFLLRFLALLVGAKPSFDILAFNNSSLMGLFGLWSFMATILFSYSSSNIFHILFPYLFAPLGLLFFIFQIISFNAISKWNFRIGVYLFLYFCAFKIIPWIWIAYALGILTFNGPIFEL